MSFYASTELVGDDYIPYYHHLINILQTSAELKQSASGVFGVKAWATAGAVTGGLFGGGAGLVIGVFVGSVYGLATSGSYESMVTVLQKLMDREKKLLAFEVQYLVGSNSLHALSRFIETPSKRLELLKSLNMFIKKTSEK